MSHVCLTLRPPPPLLGAMPGHKFTPADKANWEKREKGEGGGHTSTLGGTSSMYSKFGDNVEVEMSEFWESVRCKDRLK